MDTYGENEKIQNKKKSQVQDSKVNKQRRNTLTSQL